MILGTKQPGYFHEYNLNQTKLWVSDNISLVSEKKISFYVFAFSIERQKFIFLRIFLFSVLVQNQMVQGVRFWFSISIFPSLGPCHDFRVDGSWLFLITVTSEDVNNITGHVGAWITCNKGTLTQISFFHYYFFYICAYFLSAALTITLLTVYAPFVWIVSSLQRLAVNVVIKLEDKWCEEVAL